GRVAWCEERVRPDALTVDDRHEITGCVTAERVVEASDGSSGVTKARMRGDVIQPLPIQIDRARIAQAIQVLCPRHQFVHARRFRRRICRLHAQKCTPNPLVERNGLPAAVPSLSRKFTSSLQSEKILMDFNPTIDFRPTPGDAHGDIQASSKRPPSDDRIMGSGAAAPLCTAQRARAPRSEVWLRAWPVLLLHRVDRWPERPLVPHSGPAGGRPCNYDS